MANEKKAPENTSGTPNPYKSNPYKHSKAAEPVGMVIGNLDPALREALGLPQEYASVGIVTSTEKKASILFGADEAVK